MEYTECRKFAESVVQKAKDTLKADGYLTPLLFAVDPEGRITMVRLQGKAEDDVATLARAAVKTEGAYAAVVANEAVFAEMLDGKPFPDYHFNAIAVACVHPKGHTVWITPFAKEHGITLGKTQEMNGDNFSGPITEILR